jgi:hypothetical protein
MRSDLVARAKSARENSTTNARGGGDEVKSLILLIYRNVLTEDDAGYIPR